MTPKLPEPEGSREGILGYGEPLRILILGDSAAAGVGVDSQNDALLGQLVSKLSQYRAIEWRLLAETGLKTSEMLERLHALEAFKTDVVITSLGVNDITGGTRLKHWLEQQRELKLLLQDKFQARHIFLSSVPPMHEFPALPQPLRWFLGRRSRAMNSALNEQAALDEALAFVSVQFPMQKEFFASDGFHPSAQAYRLW